MKIKELREGAAEHFAVLEMLEAFREVAEKHGEQTAIKYLMKKYELKPVEAMSVANMFKRMK